MKNKENNCHYCKSFWSYEVSNCYQCGNKEFYKFSWIKWLQEKVQNFMIKL
jgi:primosomal protein N'